jgi:integrase
MGRRMIEPWKHPRSEILWFRRRIPKQFVEMMGRREIKFSLGTRDPDEARLRCAEENLKLERMWREQIKPRPFGIRLDYKDVVALAGEFYEEKIAVHDRNPGKAEEWEASIARDRELRRRRSFPLTPAQYRQWLYGKEADAFLSRKGISLDLITHDAFLKEFADANSQAEQALARNAAGNFSPDPNKDRFPKRSGPFANRPLGELWEEFVKDRRISKATQKKYRAYLDALTLRIKTDNMAAVTEGHLSEWVDELKGKLARKTLKEGYVAALKSFFGWAMRNKKLPVNPAVDLYVEMPAQDPPKKRGFTNAEARIVLSASLAPFSELMAKENVAARRWVPWLCAYTGARVNEITQMRSRDVMIVDGLDCVRITPEAGTVKDAKERIVPLHPHLIDMGFVKFARSRPKSAPLFYSLERQRGSDRKNPTYASVGNKLAEWVRNLGIKDPRVAPNHGWRHRFKTVARRAKMDRFIVHVIQGHAIKAVGDDYGEVEPEVMYAEIIKHPRYDVVASGSTDRRRKGRGGPGSVDEQLKSI